jgi:hypothetical protein
VGEAALYLRLVEIKCCVGAATALSHHPRVPISYQTLARYPVSTYYQMAIGAQPHAKERHLGSYQRRSDERRHTPPAACLGLSVMQPALAR